MAQKRTAEFGEGIFEPKMLKQMEENDGDVTLDSSVLSADFTSSLEYDCMLKTFSITLEKERKDGNRFICFGEEESGNIIKLLPVIDKLVCRYSVKRSAKIIDIPFDACRGDIGDLVTVVSLKENSYKRGQFDVDIRKCVKKEEGSYQYTSEGVRFQHSLINALKENLLEYQYLIANAAVKSREVISMSMATAIIRQIHELTDPRQNCQGCQSQHPSQKQHMGLGGCLSAEQPTWEQLCNQYWQEARSLIRDDEVQNLAKQAASRIPELQKAFIPELIPMGRIPDGEVKECVLRKDEMGDVPLFNILTELK